MLYSVDCFVLDTSSIDAAIHKVMLSWQPVEGSILCVVSDDKKDIFLKLSNCSWLITVLGEYFMVHVLLNYGKLGGMSQAGICKPSLVRSENCLLSSVRCLLYVDN